MQTTNFVLYRISAPHFVAGIIQDTETSQITDAAPILRYMVGWNIEKVLDYVERKRWEMEIIERE